jgi:hypothetical protein
MCSNLDALLLRCIALPAIIGPPSCGGGGTLLLLLLLLLLLVLVSAPEPKDCSSLMMSMY